MSGSSVAVTAAVAAARRLGLAVDRPEVLADRSNLIVHLKPAPVVARVATMTAILRRDPEAWLRREVELAAYLVQKGAPVVAPSADVPPGPHRQDGHLITFWAWVQDAGQVRATGGAAGRALATLHDAMLGYPGDLPLMAPIIDDMPRMLSLLRSAGWPAPDLLRWIETRHQAVIEHIHASSERRPLHGDASLSNLLVTSSGAVWVDLEDACLGPADWDLAVLARSAGADSQAILEGYAVDVSLDSLRPLVEARELQAALWSAVLASQDQAGRQAAEARLHSVVDR